LSPTAEADWWGAEIQARKQLFKRHDVIVEAEYRDYFCQNQANWDVDPYLPIMNDKRSSHLWAAYAQDEWRIFEKLILNGLWF